MLQRGEGETKPCRKEDGGRPRGRRRLRLCTRCNVTESSPMHWRQTPRARARARPVDCLLPADRSIGGRTRRCGSVGGGGGEGEGKERILLAKLAGARERRKRRTGCCFGRSFSPLPLLSSPVCRRRRRTAQGAEKEERWALSAAPPASVADSREQKTSQVKSLLSVLPFPLQQNWICS